MTNRAMRRRAAKANGNDVAPETFSVKYTKQQGEALLTLLDIFVKNAGLSGGQHAMNCFVLANMMQQAFTEAFGPPQEAPGAPAA